MKSQQKYKLFVFETSNRFAVDHFDNIEMCSLLSSFQVEFGKHLKICVNFQIIF